MKRTLQKHLQRLRKIKRSQHHPLIHIIHKKHHVSHKTLFYVKEYGSHSNVARTIIRESIWILLLTSLISSFGGLALEKIKVVFLSIIPFIILLPSLNDMIGDFGTVTSSRFSTMLHEGKVKGNLWVNSELRKLFFQILIVSISTGILSAIISLATSHVLQVAITLILIAKMLAIAVIDVVVLVSLLFVVAIVAGRYFYHKKEDPNNFLIPITTSIADFGNMGLLALLVVLFF